MNKTHSANYVPICELIDSENNIILFNENKKAQIEKNKKLLLKKKELIDEMNKRIEELKKNLEYKINEIIELNNPLYEKIQNVNNLSLDEISDMYENINNNSIKENDDSNINVELFGNLLNTKFSEIVENVNFISNISENVNSISNTSENIFKFKFREGLNYTLKNGGKIATKTGINKWDCSIIGDKEIPINKICKWRIKLNNFEIKYNRWNVLIGIGPENIYNKDDCYYKCCTFICGNSQLCMKDASSIPYFNHSGSLKKGDIVEVTVDRINGNNVFFAVNNVNYGIAFNNIPLEERIYPVVLIYDTNQTVELLD